MREPNIKTLELGFMVSNSAGAPRIVNGAQQCPRLLQRIIISPCPALEMKVSHPEGLQASQVNGCSPSSHIPDFRHLLLWRTHSDALTHCRVPSWGCSHDLILRGNSRLISPSKAVPESMQSMKARNFSPLLLLLTKRLTLLPDLISKYLTSFGWWLLTICNLVCTQILIAV